jgi:hypothetical protein
MNAIRRHRKTAIIITAVASMGLIASSFFYLIYISF